MTQMARAELIPLAEAEGVEVETYDGYSGRGMYGEATFALEVESRDDAGFLVRLARSRLSVELSIDNMGKGWIVY